MRRWNLIYLRRTHPWELLRRYRTHEVDQHSAALAYHLFFAVFPLLIFLSNGLGALQLDGELVTEQLKRLLPVTAAELMGDYFDYVSGEHNRTLMVFSLLFSVYFPYRAAHGLMRSVQRAFHRWMPEGSRYRIRAAVAAVLLLLTILAGLAAVVLGRGLLELLQRVLPLPEVLVELWLRLRFVIPTALIWGMVILLYHWALDRKVPLADLLPGILAAVAGWLAATFAFSFYVEHVANYSVVYGSIGAVIVLLLWLKLTAVLMIMGAEFDRIRLERKKPPSGGGKDNGGI